MVNFNFSDNGTIITIIKLLHSHSACPERGTRTVTQPCSKRPALQGPLWPPRYHQTCSTYTCLYTPQISSNLFNLYISVHPRYVQTYSTRTSLNSLRRTCLNLFTWGAYCWQADGWYSTEMPSSVRTIIGCRDVIIFNPYDAMRHCSFPENVNNCRRFKPETTQKNFGLDKDTEN